MLRTTPKNPKRARRAKPALLVFAIGLLCPWLAAEPANPEKLTVKVYDLPRPGEADIVRRAQRAVVDAFLAKPEKQHVDLAPFVGLRAEGMDMEVGPLMAIAGGVAPDILYVNFRKSDSYVQEGFLHPLDEYLIAESAQAGLPLDPDHPFSDDEVPDILRDRVPKPVWPVIYRAGPDGVKHVWALPYSTLVMALQYRKDLFIDAGLDPERPPGTWEEFYETARRIHDPARGIYGCGLVSGVSSSWSFMSFLWSAGADAVAQDEDGAWRCVFDSDEAVLAFDFYRKLVSDPVEKYGKTYEGVAYRAPELYMKWTQGKLGMIFAYLDSKILARVNPEEIGVAPVPTGPTGLSASELNCTMMGLSAATTDRAVLEEAWDFVWYFDGWEARKVLTDVYVQNGFGRFANPEWLRAFGYTEYIRQVPETWLRTFEQAMANGKPEPYGKNCDLVYNELSRPLETIATTKYDRPSEEIGGILEQIVTGGATNAAERDEIRAKILDLSRLNDAGRREELGAILKEVLSVDYSQAPRRERQATVKYALSAVHRLSDEERHGAIKQVLVEAVKTTNEKMLGLLSPEEDRFRKRVALIAAGLICAAFALLFYRVYRDFTPEWARGRGWDFARYKWAYVLLLPAVLTIILWRYVPLARGSVIAFQDYKIVRETEFVGLGNFAQVLFDRLFWRYLWNSTYYMLLFIGLCFWPPIFLAILLQEVPRCKILFRVLFYLPAVTSGLVIAFLWKNFYEPSDHGLLNQLILAYNEVPGWFADHVPGLAWMDHLQIETKKWLQDRTMAMLCVMLPQFWAGMGPGCIIYLAALKSIPEDFYEAADIDGAGFVKKIRHIVIPYLKPLIIINFVGAFIASFRSANYIFIMTGGGPAGATHVLGYEIFIRSFMYLKFGIGTAMAWILGSLLIGFTGYQLRILSRLQFKTVGQDENP